MKRVLCLYRVSTKKQLDPASDKSNADIPLQRKACVEFISAHPDWVLYKEMYERGVSEPKRSRSPLTFCSYSSATDWDAARTRRPLW